MGRWVVGCIAVICFLVSFPPLLFADYAYPGTNEWQALAVIEPATPDALFRTWTGDFSRTERWNIGISSQFYRNRSNTKDWDTVMSVTGAYRSRPNLLFGITLPYIIRDPKLNESNMLDMRGFFRVGLTGSEKVFRVAAEISYLQTTAGANATYPFSLESPLAGFRLAFSGGSEDLHVGANVGYQKYLQTTTGDDKDFLYGLWVEKKAGDRWSWILEYSGSAHIHTGPPGNENVKDDYALVGGRYNVSERTHYQIAAGTGLGDSYADVRVVASATFALGGTPEKKARTKEEVVIQPPVVGYDGVYIRIINRSQSKKLGKQVSKTLKKKDYSVIVETQPPGTEAGRNIIRYSSGNIEQAIRLSRTLIFGGILKSAEIQESKTKLSDGEIVLILGAIVDQPPIVGYDGVYIRIINRTKSKKLGKQVSRSLKKKDYSVIVETQPPGAEVGRNIILYSSGNIEQAIRLSRTLIFGGTLKSAEIKESKTKLSDGEIVLILGTE